MIYATNKRARFDYEILDTVEAGLVLSGGEVKSIRSGGGRIAGAFVTFRGGDAYVINFHIAKYGKAAAAVPHDAERSKKLLLKAKEINYLRGKSEEQGLTIVPLSVYTKGPFIKIEIGIAKGKKKYDKRDAIKKRDAQREIRRGIKHGDDRIR